MAKRKYILYEKEGSIARIILNKPEKLNALQFIGRGEDASEFHNALEEASNDDEVKVVVIKGAGKAFCAGHDLTKVGFLYGMGTGKPGERRPSQRIRLKLDRLGFEDHMRHFLNDKLMIAQVHGYCIGGGLNLALYCDYAIVAEDAKLGFTDQRLGFAGNSPALPILVLTVGLKRALDLLLTGRMFTGKEAEQIGLVSRAVPAKKLEEETNKIAQAFTLLPRDGIAIGKAHRHMMYERMGLLSGFTQGYLTHTMFTNLRWEPDEYNFFKERRDKGTKAGFHARDDRYQGKI